ncbi:MAG: hypothetical protein KF911_05660 [Pseudomonadales bacterium]|nr:hypothetical protein [Pseudomonadales bacterium]
MLRRTNYDATHNLSGGFSMSTRKQSGAPSPAELPRNSWLLWLAALALPESLSWCSGGFSHSLLLEVERLRRAPGAPGAAVAANDAVAPVPSDEVAHRAA